MSCLLKRRELRKAHSWVWPKRELMVQSQCFSRYLKKKCWESQLKGKAHNESLGKQGPGAQGAQGWALIYSQADTAHGEWGQPGKRLRETAPGHLKSALARKRTSETKLQCCYRHEMDVLRVNPLVTHQLFCITPWQRCEKTLGVETGSRQGSGLWLPEEISPCNSSPNSSSCSNLSPGHGHTWNFGHMNVAKFP